MVMWKESGEVSEGGRKDSGKEGRPDILGPRGAGEEALSHIHRLKTLSVPQS